jgi:hypothetical protein
MKNILYGRILLILAACSAIVVGTMCAIVGNNYAAYQGLDWAGVGVGGWWVNEQGRMAGGIAPNSWYFVCVALYSFFVCGFSLVSARFVRTEPTVNANIAGMLTLLAGVLQFIAVFPGIVTLILGGVAFIYNYRRC